MKENVIVNKLKRPKKLIIINNNFNTYSGLPNFWTYETNIFLR